MTLYCNSICNFLQIVLVLLTLILLVLDSEASFFGRRRRQLFGKKSRRRHKSKGRPPKGFIKGFEYVKKRVNDVEKDPVKSKEYYDPYYNKCHGNNHGFNSRMPHHGYNHHMGYGSGMFYDRSYGHMPQVPYGPVFFHGTGYNNLPGHYHWFPNSNSYSVSEAHHHIRDKHKFSENKDSSYERVYGKMKQIYNHRKADYLGDESHLSIHSAETSDKRRELERRSRRIRHGKVYNSKYGDGEIIDDDSMEYYSEDDVKSRYDDQRTYGHRGPKVSKTKPYPMQAMNEDIETEHYTKEANSRRRKGAVSYVPKMRSEYSHQGKTYAPHKDLSGVKHSISSYTFYNTNDIGSIIIPENDDSKENDISHNEEYRNQTIFEENLQPLYRDTSKLYYDSNKHFYIA